MKLIPEAERVMPATRPDEEALTHRALCHCEVCQRPAARALIKRRQKALRS